VGFYERRGGPAVYRRVSGVGSVDNISSAVLAALR
jgi:hypothetical protein